MKKIFFILTLLYSYSSWSLSCEKIQKLGEYLNMSADQFMDAYKKHKLAGHKDELRELVGDVNKARKVAYNFPALKDFGFPPVGKNWEPFVVKMEKSSLYGKRSGWKFTKPNGDVAVVRLDYDPVKGGHYNIEVMKRSSGKESFKISFEFDCNGKQCTPEQIQKLAQKLN